LNVDKYGNKQQFCNKKSLEYCHNIVVIRQIKKGVGGREGGWKIKMALIEEWLHK